jgi:acetyl esterase/lipase
MACGESLMHTAQRWPTFYLLFVSLLTGPMTWAADKPEKLPLWPGPAPVAEGETENANGYITVIQPAKPNGTAIVICPGGGYGGLVMGGEGFGIAKWLNQHGITGVVLQYRLPRGKTYRPLYDAQRAIRTVRANAMKWNINPKRIGIIGFSAGGHLASSAATHFDAGNADATDPIEKVSCRPDFAVMIYPVITMGPKTHGGSKRNLLGKNPTQKMVDLFSNEKQVNEKTPPCFLAHAKNDRVVVPDNSKMFYDALIKHKVNGKYIELPSGGHGLNGYKGPHWDKWQAEMLPWLKTLK